MNIAAMLAASAGGADWGALDYTLAVVALLAGLGAFLFGFKVFIVRQYRKARHKQAAPLV